MCTTPCRTLSWWINALLRIKNERTLVVEDIWLKGVRSQKTPHRHRCEEYGRQTEDCQRLAKPGLTKGGGGSNFTSFAKTHHLKSALFSCNALSIEVVTLAFRFEPPRDNSWMVALAVNLCPFSRV